MMFSQTNPVLMKHCWVKFEEPKRDGDVGSGLVTKHLGSLQRFFGFEICTYIYIGLYIYICVYIYIYTVDLTILWNIVEYQLDSDPQATVKLILKLFTGHRTDTCLGIGILELLHPSGVPSIHNK